MLQLGLPHVRYFASVLLSLARRPHAPPHTIAPQNYHQSIDRDWMWLAGWLPVACARFLAANFGLYRVLLWCWHLIFCIYQLFFIYSLLFAYHFWFNFRHVVNPRACFGSSWIEYYIRYWCSSEAAVRADWCRAQYVRPVLMLCSFCDWPLHFLLHGMIVKLINDCIFSLNMF